MNTSTAARLAERFGSAVDIHADLHLACTSRGAGGARGGGRAARDLDLDGKLVLLTGGPPRALEGRRSRAREPGRADPFGRRGFAMWWSATAASATACKTRRARSASSGSATFTGPVDETSKLALYSLCDVWLPTCCSRLVPGRFRELRDRLARGGDVQPAVGGRVGGTADAVDDEVTGLLVDIAARAAHTKRCHV